MKQKMKWLEHVVPGGREEVNTGFWWGNLRKGNPLEDLRVAGRILKLIIKNWDGVMDWIDLVQERDSWWSLVNEVMNVQFPKNAGNLLTS
jgi:hypothetical protein